MIKDLWIRFPSPAHDALKKALPTTFVAAGTVRAAFDGAGKQKRGVNAVRACLRHYLCDGTLGAPYQTVKARHLRPVEGGQRLQWAVVFKQAAPPGGAVRVRLAAEALVRGSKTPVACDTVDLWVASKPIHTASPTMDWPDTNGYTIEGQERDYFLCWGGSDLPVTSLTLGGTPTAPDWNDVDHVWYGIFNPGTSPGTGNDYALLASNAEGENFPRIVHVAPA